jgi:hypothetical protein
MPYVPGAGVHGVVHVADVYHSGNVYANNVNVALWLSPGGTDAVTLNAVMAMINDPNYEKDKEVQEAVEGETVDELAVAKEQKRLVESGVVTQQQLNAGNGAGANPAASSFTATITSSPAVVTSATTIATAIDETILYEGQLNDKDVIIKVKDVTKIPGVIFPYDVASLAEANGTTVQAVCDNLRALVVNCWVPLKTRFPDAFMTCSFRKGGVGSPTSQHPKGMAMDIQYASASKADYYTRALWVRDNLRFDQFLLEYKTTGTGKPWHHISFSTSGNRQQVCTFMNDKNCKGPGVQGLFDLSNA